MTEHVVNSHLSFRTRRSLSAVLYYNIYFLLQVCAARTVAEQRVKSLKELSWTKANALLSTAYGQKAVNSVDSTATYAMQLLDHYLPPVDPQEKPSCKLFV